VVTVGFREIVNSACKAERSPVSARSIGVRYDH
jgi:hypothetical protein